MRKLEDKQQITPAFLSLIGIFFLYLAIVEGEISGNSLLLGLLGIGCLFISFLLCKPVRSYLTHKAGITEVDLEDEDTEDTL